MKTKTRIKAGPRTKPGYRLPMPGEQFEQS